MQLRGDAWIIALGSRTNGNVGIQKFKFWRIGMFQKATYNQWNQTEQLG